MHNAHRPTTRNLSLPLATTALSLLLASNMALAESSHSSKLLLTGGVSQIEGAAGGGYKGSNPRSTDGARRSYGDRYSLR